MTKSINERGRLINPNIMNLSLIEDDINVSTQVLEKLDEREAELRAQLDRIRGKGRRIKELEEKLSVDKERVVSEESQISDCKFELEAINTEKQQLEAELESLDEQIANIEGSVKGQENSGIVEGRNQEVMAHLSALEKTLEQKKVRLANREKTVSNKRRQLEEFQSQNPEFTLFNQLKDAITREQERAKTLANSISSIQENIRYALSRHDLGDGTGIYARQLVIAELSEQSADTTDFYEEEDDVPNFDDDIEILKVSLEELEELRDTRLTSLKQELASLTDDGYLKTLRQEREETERRLLENL